MQVKPLHAWFKTSSFNQSIERPQTPQFGSTLSPLNADRFEASPESNEEKKAEAAANMQFKTSGNHYKKAIKAQQERVLQADNDLLGLQVLLEETSLYDDLQQLQGNIAKTPSSNGHTKAYLELVEQRRSILSQIGRHFDQVSAKGQGLRNRIMTSAMTEHLLTPDELLEEGEKVLRIHRHALQILKERQQLEERPQQAVAFL